MRSSQGSPVISHINITPGKPAVSVGVIGAPAGSDLFFSLSALLTEES